MRSRKDPAALPRGPKRGKKMTLSFGLVNIEAKLAPLVRSASGRTSAAVCCAEHRVPLSKTHGGHGSQYRCPAGDEIVEETISLYEVNGQWVEVDTAELGMERDPTLQLVAAVDPGTIDPLYFEKSYVLWPQEGVHEAAYDLVTAVLRKTGQLLVGTTWMSKATRAVVLRWSDIAGCLVVHLCTYDERIAWDELRLVSHGIESGRQPTSKELALAEQLVGQLADEELDFATVSDEYAAQLLEAIDAAAAGTPMPVREPEEEKAPVVDLVAALQASVGEVTGADKPPAKKRAAAKRKKAA